MCANDAWTVGSVQYAAWRVELRYSNNCETTWTRKIYLGGSALPSNVYHESRYLNGTLRASVKNGFVPPGANWTTMLDDHGLSNRGVPRGICQ